MSNDTAMTTNGMQDVRITAYPDGPCDVKQKCRYSLILYFYCCKDIAGVMNEFQHYMVETYCFRKFKLKKLRI